MGLCVLLAGVCTALLLRRDRARHAPGDPVAAEQLLIRRSTDIPPARAGAKGSPTRWARRGTDAGGWQRPAVVLTPDSGPQSPPPLAPQYPETEPATAGPVNLPPWPDESLSQMGPVRLPPVSQSQTTHKIVDGDTLEDLAERYLGSAVRASDIFKANRNVLTDPRLLPIGVELIIPPRGRHATPASDQRRSRHPYIHWHRCRV